MKREREQGHACESLCEVDLETIESMRTRVLRESGYHYLPHLARHLIEKEIPELVRAIRRHRRGAWQEPAE
jgi:hypothetical protein